MKLKTVYLILFIVGTIVPYYFFISFLIEHGIDTYAILQNMLANKISTFFVSDVIISAICLFVLSFASRKMIGIYWILPVVATLCIGVSAGLPLFLYLREK